MFLTIKQMNTQYGIEAINWVEAVGLSLADVTSEITVTEIEETPVVRLDEDGKPVLDEAGSEITDIVDREVDRVEIRVDEVAIAEALEALVPGAKLLAYSDDKPADWSPWQDVAPDPMIDIHWRVTAGQSGLVRARPSDTKQATLKASVKAVLAQQNFDWTGLQVSLEPFAPEPPSLDQAKAELTAAMNQMASGIRAKVAGTSDPVKLAEYADKAASVDAILAGTATAAQMAEATAEAALRGVADAAAMAAIWQQMADGLRQARLVVNTMVTQTGAAIDGATSLEELEAIKTAALAQADAALAAILAAQS